MVIIKEKIKKIIEESVNMLHHDFHDRENRGVEILVKIPKEKKHGDYSTNVALILSKKLNKDPIEIANKITTQINYSSVLKNIGVEKVEVAGPGFINFCLSKDFFVDNLKKVLKKKEDFGKNATLKSQKIIIEYTDPNHFKEFHIGHLMSNVIGESISRIFEFGGAKVKRANYQGDVGLHVAKAIWGKIKNPNQSWQNAYVLGTNIYNENEATKQEIIRLNKKIFERSDKTINKIYDAGKKWSLKYFEKIYKTLGTKFDYYFFESKVADFGKKIVEDELKKNIFEKGEKGAIVFKGEKFGLHTRVFINSEGLPTYEAKDLALTQIKYGKYKYEKSVIVTANEQNDYFKVMLCALKQINSKLAEKTKHVGHGMMRLPEGKMSSRTGKVVTFEFLLNEVEKLVIEKIKKRDLSEVKKRKIVEKVAIGALKYSILKQSIGNDIIYDFEKSISFDGDSGPYLQYSYARAKSVLKKARGEKIKASFKNIPTEISQLGKMMAYFPDVVEKSGSAYEPHYITLYLTELAREFNNYYVKNKIVDKKNQLSPYKIALTEAFSIIMKNGLWMLGISILDKM